MNNIRSGVESQLEKLSPRDKKLLTGLFLFFSLGALVLLTVTLVGLQRSLQADVESATSTFLEVQKQQAAYDIAAAKLVAQKARLDQFDSQVLSAHVESIAQELNIQEGLRDAQRAEQVKDNGITTTKWKVVLKGRSYEETIQFIMRLENSGYPMRVENARLKKVTVARESAIDLTLDLLTYKIEEGT